MFRFVILSVLVAVSAAGVIDYHHAPVVHHQPAVVHHEIGHKIDHVAKTIIEPHHTVVETPTISHVGSKIHNVPSGVSHHESSVVHSYGQVHEPVYAHGVEKHVISKPVVKTIAEPYIQKHVVATPIVKQEKIVAAPVHYAAAPAVHYSAPAVVKSVVAAPAQISYAHAPAYTTYAHSAPLAYAHQAYPAYASAYKAW